MRGFDDGYNIASSRQGMSRQNMSRQGGSR